jgi:hypothetical protein
MLQQPSIRRYAALRKKPRRIQRSQATEDLEAQQRPFIEFGAKTWSYSEERQKAYFDRQRQGPRAGLIIFHSNSNDSYESCRESIALGKKGYCLLLPLFAHVFDVEFLIGPKNFLHSSFFPLNATLL